MDSSHLIRHFYEVMTEQEKIKLKSLNILKNGVIHRTNRNNFKKNYSISFPLTISVHNIPTIPGARETREQRETRESRENRATRIFHPIKEIQMEYIAAFSREVFSPIKYFPNGNNLITTVNNRLYSSNVNSIKAKRIITKNTKV
jgi:hypothetical protein